jgi:hypothetical protein
MVIFLDGVKFDGSLVLKGAPQNGLALIQRARLVTYYIQRLDQTVGKRRSSSLTITHESDQSTTDFAFVIRQNHEIFQSFLYTLFRDLVRYREHVLGFDGEKEFSLFDTKRFDHFVLLSDDGGSLHDECRYYAVDM